MARYIDVYALMQRSKFDDFGCIDWSEILAVITNEDLAPTADVQPVVHGKWIPTKDDNKKECSNCEIIHLIAQYPHGQINYCPNCGAKMDGNKEDKNNE